MNLNRPERLFCLPLALAALLLAAPHAAAAPAACRKVVLKGEVTAGQEWNAPIGQGWVFRIIPIQQVQLNVSGWDLVVDRDPPAGYPDALLLATPPWNSINEHEIGTTFGLRAQDAIGWNPRSFHFLTDPQALREGQKLFRLTSAAQPPASQAAADKQGSAIQRQLQLNQHASAGEFRILDAHLTPGIADAASYAENWALQSAKTPHTPEAAPGGKSTPLGELHWVKFTVTLWLPQGFQTPKALSPTPAPCPE